MTIEVSFPTDSDGFLSQECPSCEQQFKVLFGQGSEDPISFCPYCGFNDHDCWFTKEQSSHMRDVAADKLVMPELRNLERRLKRESSGLINVSLKSDVPGPSRPPMETDGPFEILHFPCCQESVKLNRMQSHFCIICGTEIDMTISDAKRVFLSHKGANKKLVNEFKETLELLGYQPWLDEDAMPAGARIDRELLQGMKDSCGVVFFITQEFKDEGFLGAEIEYALDEDRRKGEKFAIIPLVFVGDDGQSPPIPELLQRFIRKTPASDLEALKEIIRALPVVPGAVDWRKDISDVATLPMLKSTSSDLSEEAKQILEEAVNGNNWVMHVKTMGREVIQVNGRNMIPDKNDRTIAMWVAGLEDLQRLRYIRGEGTSGTSFVVTREGYQAADDLGLTHKDSQT